MVDYNYNFEIASNMAFFQSVFDDILIKRYDYADKRVTDTIKVNVKYAPKMRIIEDIRGQPDTVKFPIAAISIAGMGRDDDRIKNKTQPLSYKNSDSEIVNLNPIPWNISVKMDILAKSQEDLDQIITNFAVLCNPYIVFSWREPKSGKEVRSEVHWDGDVAHTYPTHGGQLDANMPWRLEASATFTIKTHLYRTAIDNSKPICTVNLDVIPVDQLYCNYETLSAAYKDNDKDSFELNGYPQLRWVDNYYFKTGETPTITVQGAGFQDLYGLFVSGSNPDMYPLTKYYPISGSDEFFEGYVIDEYVSNDPTTLTFTLPAASAFGFCDIIAVNSCGYSKLTEDANRCSRVLNPYPTSLSEHYTWCVNQYPYLNGLIISNDPNNYLVIDRDEGIIVVDQNTILEESCGQQLVIKRLTHVYDHEDISDFDEAVNDIINLTVLNSNSGNWDSVYATVESLSAVWSASNTYDLTLVNENSSCWQTACETVSVYSSTSGTFLTIDDVATQFVHITGDIMTGSLSAPSISAENLYVRDNTIFFIDSVGDVVANITANKVDLWDNNYIFVNTTSATWQESYTNLVDNSALYLQMADVTVLQESSSYWNNTSSVVESNSADWNTSFDPANPGDIGADTPGQAIFTNLSGNNIILPNTNAYIRGTGGGFLAVGKFDTSGGIEGAYLNVYKNTDGGRAELVFDSTSSSTAGLYIYNYTGSYVQVANIDKDGNLTLLGGVTVAGGNSQQWNNSFTVVSQQSANNISVYSTVNTNSSFWQDSYTNLIDNSALYLQMADVTILNENSGNWNSVYSSYNTNSGSFLTVETDPVFSAWEALNGDLLLEAVTTFTEQSGNNSSVYTTVNTNSSSWLGGGGDLEVNTFVYENSANTIDVYTTVNTNSASWINSVQTLIFDDTTSDLTISGGNTISLSSLDISNLPVTSFNTPVTASGDFLIINIGGIDRAIQLWDF